MGQYTSYYLYQKYEQREGQDSIPCTPNIYSIDGQGTMQKVIKLDDDPECGYTPEPTEPIYRWYQMPISEGYVCDECPELQYRWVESGTTCVGFDKWNRSIEQYSEDGGTTWHNTNPPVYSATSLIEVDSEDCGYVPPTPTTPKFSATYTTGSTYSLECNGNSTLTVGETNPTGYNFKYMLTANIGDCVTIINDGAFGSCINLTSVTISSSVTSINTSAFSGCRSLTNIVMPNSITNIGNWAFGSCSGLTSIDIPNSVVSIGESAFQYCYHLTSIDIPNSVTSVKNQAFYKCSGLTAVTIGSNISNLGNDMTFYGCSSLQSVTINATTPPAIGSMIFDNTNRCPIYVPSGSVNTYKTASGWSSYASRIQAIP